MGRFGILLNEHADKGPVLYFIYRIRQAWNGNACTGPKNPLISAIFWAAYGLKRW